MNLALRTRMNRRRLLDCKDVDVVAAVALADVVVVDAVNYSYPFVAAESKIKKLNSWLIGGMKG